MRHFKIFKIVVMAGLCIASVNAETSTGRVTGLVKDSSGSVVQNAVVTVTNEQTGAQRTVRTNNDGLYTIVSLQPSEYDLRVVVPGFAPVEIQHLSLAVGQDVNHDFKVSPAGTQTQGSADAGSIVTRATSPTQLGANLPRRTIQNPPSNRPQRPP